ncbi:MAG: hypothetical protein ACQEWI_17315 [Bacillota bacterium]
MPRPRSAKLRRIGRTLAASETVPLTIQHTLIDTAQTDLKQSLRKEPFYKKKE